MNEMKQYLSALLQELESGRSVVSVTIIERLGSAPRGTGARMLVGEKGRITGTVGGGPLEYEVQREAVRLLRTGTSSRRTYDLSQSASQAGMICGGRVSAAFHYFSVERADVVNLFRTALKLLKVPGDLWLILELPFPSESETEKTREAVGIYGPDKNPPPGIPYIVIEYLAQGRTGVVSADEKEYYLERIAKDSIVHIFGGGHVARELVPMLSGTGFSCVVYDDREEFIKKEDFPKAYKTIAVSFDRLEKKLYPATENYFVIMTRGHLSDLQAQAFALKTPSLYIGVMGSRKKRDLLSEKLLEMGFTQEDLRRVHAPIGLDIGAETPAEIAVCIAAELILVRSKDTIIRKRLAEHPELTTTYF